MDVETMHVMYFSGSNEAVTKINHVPYQTIGYDDKSMFWVKLMDDTQVQIFIGNGATPSILPLSIYVALRGSQGESDGYTHTCMSGTINFSQFLMNASLMHHIGHASLNSYVIAM